MLIYVPLFCFVASGCILYAYTVTKEEVYLYFSGYFAGFTVALLALHPFLRKHYDR